MHLLWVIRHSKPLPILLMSKNQDNPTGLIPPQTSKAPMSQTEAPFEFEVDPTALKVNKLEKLFKQAHGVNSIPDIEDGHTESAVTLPEWFKMSHINHFDGSRDPMVLCICFLIF
ncbi:hypothetical protein ACSBR2_014445 [Camellia fascicularis]